MKIELEIPESKFKVGDFVRQDRDERGLTFVRICRIEHIIFSGTFDVVDGQPYLEIENSTYRVTYQEGSFAVNGSPIRPGVSGIIPMSDLDQFGQICPYEGEVWTPDTPDNWLERLDAWEPRGKL